MTTILSITDNLRIRWREPFLTEGLNKKMFGTVRPGVYDGFYVKADGATGVLQIIPEPDHVSILATTSSIVADADPDYWILQDTGAVFTEADLLRSVQPALAANPLTNTGPFLITEIVSSMQVKIYSSTAIAEPSGTMTWTIGNGSNMIAHIADDAQGLSGTINVNGFLTTPNLFSDPASSGPLLAAIGVGGTFWLALDFSYSKGADSTASIQFIFDVQEFVSNTRLLRLCQIDIPASPLVPPLAFQQSHISQVTRSDFANPLWTTRPWATAAESGLAHPGYRRIAVPYIQDFTTGSPTITLSGKYYIGHGPPGSANKYFALAQQLPASSSFERQLLSSANKQPITILEIRDALSAGVLNPATQADADGFYENPKIIPDFSLVDPVITTFAGQFPRVLAHKEASVGRLTGTQTSAKTVRSFVNHSRDVPVIGKTFTHIPTTVDDVQEALEALDTATTGFGNGVVTVGPVGSGADFTGSDHLPFTAALTTGLTASGGQIIVLPGTYTFTAIVPITTSNVRISGVALGNVDSTTAAVVLRLADGAYRGTGLSTGGGLFEISDVNNIVFEDIVFRDDAVITSHDYRALLCFKKTAGVGASFGPDIRRCVFANATKAGTSVAIIVTGGSGYFENTIVEECTLQATQAEDRPLVEFVDVASYRFSRNRFQDSTNTQTQPVLSVLYPSYTAVSSGRVEDNYIDSLITGTTGKFVFLSVTSAPGSVLQILNNKFETRGTPTSAAGLVHIACSGIDANVVVRGNTIASRVGGNASAITLSGNPAILEISGNALNLVSGAAFLTLRARSLFVLDNFIRAGGVPGLYFDATPGATLRAVISRNDWQLTSAAPSGLSAIDLPENTVFSENRFYRVLAVDPSFLVGFRIRSNSVISNNEILFSDTSCIAGTVILALSDGAGGVLSNIRIEGNRIAGRSGITNPSNFAAAIGSEFSFLSDVQGLVVSGNSVEYCKYLVFMDTANAANSLVADNVCVNLIRGVHLGTSAVSGLHNAVVSNTFQFADIDDGDGTYGVRASGYTRVAHNLFKGHLSSPAVAGVRRVIQVEDSCVVESNILDKMQNCSIGIDVEQDSTVSNNSITSLCQTLPATGSATAAIYASSARITITGNYIRGVDSTAPDELRVVYCTAEACVVSNNDISALTAKSSGVVYGISVEDDSLCEGNLIRGVTGLAIVAISVVGDRSIISGNKITEITLVGATPSTLVSVTGAVNSIIGNTLTSVSIDDVLQGIVVSGIRNMIADNNISGLTSTTAAVAGIGCTGADDCQIIGNSIADLTAALTLYGISIAGGDRVNASCNSIKSLAGGGLINGVVVLAGTDHVVDSNSFAVSAVVSVTTHALRVATAINNPVVAVGNILRVAANGGGAFSFSDPNTNLFPVAVATYNLTT